MFIRIKPSSNALYKKVQLVENIRTGDRVSQKIIRHIGTAHNELELEHFIRLGHHIKAQVEEERQPTLFGAEVMAELSLIKHDNAKKTPAIHVEDLIEESRSVVGIHDVYGQVYKELGFDKILPNPARKIADLEAMKHITMARIATPASKHKSVEILANIFGVSVDLDRVYRLMDKIDDEVVRKLQALSFKGAQQTLALFNEEVDVLFYDATTLYFESFTEDELKENGYSKDCKFNQPQVILCLFVTTHGLPVGYEVFPGSTYEGHTLIKALEGLKDRFAVRHLVFVADSGLLNAGNLKLLEESGYIYIVGARLKSLSKQLQQQVTNLDVYEHVEDGVKVQTLELEGGRRLIASHSSKRARKDEHDRNKAIDCLRKKLKKSKNPESLISNYGYKKYLMLHGKSEVTLNEAKILEQAKWDGLHGVITNSRELEAQDILAHYRGLWQVEETFRVSKSDLKIRPIYHWTPNRIRAHIALCYMALCCVRNLEYRVKRTYEKLSPEVIRETLFSVQASVLRHKPSNRRYLLPSCTLEHATKIYQVMGLKLSTQPIAL